MRTTNTKHSTRFQLIAAFAGLAFTNACAVDEAVESEEEVESEEAVVAALGGTGNVVTSWASIAADAIVRPVEEATTLNSPGTSAMLMAQVQLAVYDALQAIEGHYEDFSFDQYVSGSTSREAAVATAAYRILRTRVPGRAVYLDGKYAETMNAIAAGTSKTRGVSLGEAAAQHYLTLRQNDNLGGTYTWAQPTPGPGVFEPVVATPPVDYKLKFVPPYTFSASQSASFFPAAPPALTSSQYATAYNEVKSMGGANSPTRTEAQKQLALWSAEHPFRWSSRNLIELAVAKGLDRSKSSRFLALSFTSIADSIQSGMSAKYHYNFWRPFHSVPRAETDNNAATAADPAWAPLLNVNHPEYPAGHGFVGAGAVVESVRAFFRTDSVSWTLTTVGVTGLTQTSRAYTSLNALASDIKNARVYAGLHYRFAVDAGQAQGRAIVNHINSRFFHND